MNPKQLSEAAMKAMGGRDYLTGLHSLGLNLRTVAYRVDDPEEDDSAPPGVLSALLSEEFFG